VSYDERQRERDRRNLERALQSLRAIERGQAELQTLPPEKVARVIAAVERDLAALDA
jgi:hypothetical protein